MNAERLLHAFSMIGEDPARVQQLRQVVVALAIAGRLGSDNATVSPREMMRAVEQVKADLFKRRAIPKPKKLTEVEQDDLPEGFPDSTHFAPLGSLARVEKGLTGIKQARPGPFPLVVTGAGRASCDHFDFEGAAAIIPLVSSTGHGHASLNRLHYQEGKFALGTILAAVFPYDPTLVSARFIFEYLSAFKEQLLVTRMTGTANVTLSVGRIAEAPVPLIDPAIQAAVDELMALCDRLEEARATRETTRDRLTAASLARLSAPDADAETFRTHARFALDALPAFTTRPDQIKILRQTILNLAVRGKLVEQDPADEPATQLLERIAAEKARLVKAGAARRDNTAPVAPPDQQTFPVPKSWAWIPAAFPAYGVTDLGKKVQTKEVLDSGAYPVVDQGKVLVRGYCDDPEKVIRVAAPLIVFGDHTRETKLIDFDFVVGADGVKLLQPVCINPHYYFLALQWLPLDSRGYGRHFKLLKASALPLPPLAEQHRIVAKVDALMALCDRLEAALTNADTTRARLLEALLAEALDPASVQEMEAAE
ncbi:MAG: restriction endonuclease subunit S [Rhodospirillaceae bacterium]